MLYVYAMEPDVLITWDKCRITLNLMVSGMAGRSPPIRHSRIGRR